MAFEKCGLEISAHFKCVSKTVLCIPGLVHFRKKTAAEYRCFRKTTSNTTCDY